VVDDAGQSALHKASMSSLSLVKMLLGVDSSAGIIVPEAKRAPLILKTDVEGKDCRLLAAIAGQSDVLRFLNEIVAGNRQASSAAAAALASSSGGELGWQPSDVNKVLKLAETGNETCLAYVLEVGFDPSWSQEETGTTLTMAACKHGHLGFINALLDRGVHFGSNQKDLKGQTSWHYAASCSHSPVIAHLLTHSKAAECGLNEMGLAEQDEARGFTPLHIAVEANVLLSVDLLAASGLEKALKTKSVLKNPFDEEEEELTPFLLASKMHRMDMMAQFLDLTSGACARDVDTKGRNAIWWLFHPDAASVQAVRRPVASEFLSRKGLGGKTTKKERDAATAQMQLDTDTVMLLVKSGCSLYSTPRITVEELLAIDYDYNKVASYTAAERKRFEPGDMLVQEQAVGLLKMLPDVCSQADCWRLIISSLRFDDTACGAFKALLEGGAADVLALQEGQERPEALRKVISKETIVPLESGPTFAGSSIAAWCVRLGNDVALQQLLRRNYNVSLPADASGDSCLHIIARYGTASMIDAVMNDERTRIEAETARGTTPLMEASRVGNYFTCKRLVKKGANARRGLAGKYWGWLLLMAQRQEACEKNVQTGRIGNDDDAYFAASFPYWYLEAMGMSAAAASKKAKSK